METVAFVFTLISASLHVLFFVFEMFLWTTPTGLKLFHMNEEKARSSKIMAANQAIYNGMLAAGLLLSLILPESVGAVAIRLFCLAFIIVVGCYGSYTLKNFKVFVVQAVPAIIAFTATLYVALSN